MEIEKLFDSGINDTQARNILADKPAHPTALWGVLKTSPYEVRYNRVKRGWRPARSKDECDALLEQAEAAIPKAESRIKGALTRLVHAGKATLLLEGECGEEELQMAADHLDSVNASDIGEYDYEFFEQYLAEIRMRYRARKAILNIEKPNEAFSFVAGATDKDLSWALNPVCDSKDFHEWARVEFRKREHTRPECAGELGLGVHLQFSSFALDKKVQRLRVMGRVLVALLAGVDVGLHVARLSLFPDGDALPVLKELVKTGALTPEIINDASLGILHRFANEGRTKGLKFLLEKAGGDPHSLYEEPGEAPETLLASAKNKKIEDLVKSFL